jgi:hypothetical protein
MDSSEEINRSFAKTKQKLLSFECNLKNNKTAQFYEVSSGHHIGKIAAKA